jgi:hypothetical protein
MGFQLRESREFLRQHIQHLRIYDLDGYSNRRIYALPHEVDSSIQNSSDVNGRRVEIGSCKVNSKVHSYLHKYTKERSRWGTLSLTVKYSIVIRFN